MGTIIDVRKIVEDKKEVLKIEIARLGKKGIVPKLGVILANELDASRIYVENKRKLCDELGVIQVEYEFDISVTTEKIIDTVKMLNNDESIDGILVQLPLFKHLDETKILESIDSRKDVDGFSPLNLGKLFSLSQGIVACTPRGIMSIIDSTGQTYVGKEAVVIGRSIIVGKPVAQLLLARGATVTTCHSKTKDLKSHTKRADILVVAVGKPYLVTADMVKEGAIVIDVGINRVNGKVIGDVDTNKVSKVASYITPVPGGVGITTVVSLIENLVDIAKKRSK
ncbi:MAG: tetrahydrofolate dehydrogenase/cyclohydrolase catalytic domain-containing protein [Clostridia bacterium]